MPLFLSIDQSFANPEEFLPLRFHRSVQKVLKNLGQCNDFGVQKRAGGMYCHFIQIPSQLAHGRSEHRSAKITAVSFKSFGVTGSSAETDSKQKQIITKQNGVRGNNPRITWYYIQRGLTRYNKTDP